MKYLISILAIISKILFAQEAAPTVLNLKAICQGQEDAIESHQQLVIADQGFCEQFLKLEEENNLVDSIELLNTTISPNIVTGCNTEIPQIYNNEIIPATATNQAEDKWKFRLYASHSFTTYFNSDISFRSSRYSVDIKDYEWAERSSREFFNPQTWMEPGNNPLQIIDEPTNTFVISMEKNGNEFFLSAFHPKFLQAENQIKYMQGTIDGVPVDGIQYVNKPFDVYDQVPGESELVGNVNSHLQMNYEIGYGKRFNLDLKRAGSLTWTPSIGVGVMMGRNHSIYLKENEWWEYDYYNDKLKVQGFGGSITNRFEYNTPKERFGIFYENKIAGYKQNHGFMDGTQKYNLGFMGNSVGVKFMIYNPKNQKKP